MVEALPRTRYVVGDNAYTASEHVLVPFAGADKSDPLKDTYNFHLSQVRIRIEMAFGRLVSKWRIFKAPLSVKIKNATRIIYCCTHLHNYCINEGDLVPEPQPGDPKELPAEYYSARGRSTRGQSMMRVLVLQKISDEGLSRPLYNVVRNENN